MLLLLLWRHLAFYLEGRHIDNPDLKGSIAHTMRFASSPDVDTLRAEAQRKLAPVLGALQSLDLVRCSLLLSCDHGYGNLTDSCAIERGDTGTRLALVRELPDDHGEEARGHCRARGGARAAAR